MKEKGIVYMNFLKQETAPQVEEAPKMPLVGTGMGW